MIQGQTKLQVQVFRGEKCISDASYERFPVVFGRSKDCHLCLKDFNFVSRNHGSIAVNKGNILVTDLNSSNGIWFGDTKDQIRSMTEEGSFRIEDLTFKLKLIEDTKTEILYDPDKTVVEKTQVTALSEGLAKKNLQTKNQDQKGSNRVSESSGAHKSEVQKQVPGKPTVDLKPLLENKSANVFKTPFSVPQKESVSEHTEVSDFIWSKIEFSTLPDPEIYNLTMADISVQGALIWCDEIYDVRNFNLGERIKLGPKQTEPLYVPIFQGERDLGIVRRTGAKLMIPLDSQWKVHREGLELSLKELMDQGHVQNKGSYYRLILAMNEVVSIDIGSGMQFRLRYVPIPRPLIRKTWIENRDEFKRAITTSLGIHFALSLLALFLAPKSEGPKVKDVPQRFAKLLVEPPKQTFAFEPPPPPPEEPPPPPEEKKPEPVLEKKKEIVKKIVKPKPVVKVEKVKPVPVASKLAPPMPLQKALPVQVKAPIQAVAPPPPSAEQDLANLFNTMPASAAPAGGGQKALAININKGTGIPSRSGTRVSGLMSGSETTNTNGAVGLGLGGQSGKVGYAQGKNTKAGQQGVAGAVVGAPSFSGVAAEQGITNEEVMKVVNKYLNDIHRCYERALFNDSNIVGRVEYEWEISSQGNVTSVGIKRSEVSNGDFLNTCVMGVFKKMKFPAAKNGQTTTATIGFPFGKN